MTAGDASAEGMIRLVASDASETAKVQIERYATQILDPTDGDPRVLPTVLLSPKILNYADKLILEYMPLEAEGDVATDPTESDTHSLVRVPVSIKNITTGNVFSTFLTSYHFNPSATNYTGLAVGTWAKIGEYSISAQEQLRVGHKLADNSKIRIELKTSA